MKALNLLYLYPNEMNTYGDNGNLLALKTRISWHGYSAEVSYHHPGKTLPKHIDIVIGGGGQDSAQADVQQDIQAIGPDLHRLADEGTPMLMVCGTYQLFGYRYITQDKVEVRGIGIFDAETVAGPKRMIGNIAVETKFGTLFGFENHSGQTFLGKNQQPLGKVLRGGGNNGSDKTEGARTGNVFGTYMHGPILPNNPALCDELIKLAAIARYGEFTQAKIDDSIVEIVRSDARARRY